MANQCATPWEGYSYQTQARTSSRMSWASSTFLVDGSQTACPDLVEASGGDQYPMRVAVFANACTPGATVDPGNWARSTRTGLYTDVEPAPWVASDGSRAVLAARSARDSVDDTACQAGVEVLTRQPCASCIAGFELEGRDMLSRMRPTDLEVADLWGTGVRQVIAVGRAVADPGYCLAPGACDAVAAPAYPGIPAGDPSDICQHGGLAVLRPGALPTSPNAKAAAILVLTDDFGSTDTQLGQPSWVRVADTNNDGRLELLAAFSAVGVLRATPPQTEATWLTDGATTLARMASASVPLCSNAPNSDRCWLYKDNRLSVDAELFVPDTSPPDRSAGQPMELVEALTCAPGHTTCAPASKLSGAGVSSVVTVRNASTGALIAQYPLRADVIPMSVTVADACGIADAPPPGGCSGSTERPAVLLGASTVELDPVYLLAQELLPTITSPATPTWHPITSAPRGWYRDTDTLAPLAPQGAEALDPQTACTGPLPASVVKIPAGLGAADHPGRTTTLSGSGGFAVVGACSGSNAWVPPCTGLAGQPATCFSTEPGERFATWVGPIDPSATYLVYSTGPQDIMLTNSFMGTGQSTLWYPETP